jgi:hypothetical protein
VLAGVVNVASRVVATVLVATPPAARERHRARADGPRAAERRVDLLDLTGVDAAAEVEAYLLHCCRDRRRPAQCLHRLSERREEAVTRGVLLPPAVPLQLLAHHRAEARQHDPPTRVSELGGERGRANDVNEEHRHQPAVPV